MRTYVGMHITDASLRPPVLQTILLNATAIFGED